ncbi:hypothetical protein JOE57_000819 [Microlunatus panaciterrae]|uniref:Uncharacterized protein n=1 Tax=Microlunatus panaciterrae TaxID=400768 RepID=A0ABS2RGT9_9ACTN|nr:hypothetical protein [Microlunatus panaciterrae]MBM7797898.1 hypothetical protein [Microlunatus panaciterrae]
MLDHPDHDPAALHHSVCSLLAARPVTLGLVGVGRHTGSLGQLGRADGHRADHHEHAATAPSADQGGALDRGQADG